MSFSYGSFYGMTGILSLYTSPDSFDAILTAGTLSRDTRYRLMNLYQELYSIKQVFSNTNLADKSKTSDDIPKLIVSTDVNHTRAKNYLRGLNNYLNCHELFQRSQSEMCDNQNMRTEAVSTTSVFSSDAEALDFDLDSSETLDFDNVESLDFDDSAQSDINSDFLNLDSVEATSDETSLLMAYEQYLEQGKINLEEFGRQYKDPNFDDYKDYSWTEAMKVLRNLKNDLVQELESAQSEDAVQINKELSLIASFIEQKRNLPCIITRCSLPPLLKQQISKVFGFSSIDNDTNVLKLLNAIYSHAYEPVAAIGSNETVPLIDRHLAAIQRAINTEDNMRSTRFSRPMSTIRLWETAEYNSIFHTISSILEKSFDDSIKRKEEVIQELMHDCDDLLGKQVNSEFQNVTYSAEDINSLLSANGREYTDYMTVCNKSSSKLDKDVQISFLEFLVDTCLTIKSISDPIAFIQRATSSDDNIKFLYTLKVALQRATFEFVNVVKECCNDLLEFESDDTLNINLSNSDKLNLIELFKKFTVFTGICGCTFDPVNIMIATIQQTDSAVAYVKPVVFTKSDNAYKALAVMRRNLQSTLTRLRRMTERG